MFFHNGDSVQADILPLMLQEVYGLLDVIKSCHQHRFFSTSLLIIYEGDLTRERRITVRLIDFARTMSLVELQGSHGADESSTTAEGAAKAEEGNGEGGTCTAHSESSSNVTESTEGLSSKDEYFVGPDKGLMRGLHSFAEVIEQIMFRCTKRSSPACLEAISTTRRVEGEWD